MDNPAAFPIVAPSPRDGTVYVDPGMTLRDYFAAKAMQLCVRELVGKGAEVTPDFTAEWAYELADAMLAEREKGANK